MSFLMRMYVVCAFVLCVCVCGGGGGVVLLPSKRSRLVSSAGSLTRNSQRCVLVCDAMP